MTNLPEDKKLNPIAVSQILCGFATNGYLLLNPVTWKVTKSCDEVCMEDQNCRSRC